jgi:hypothetical protein
VFEQQVQPILNLSDVNLSDLSDARDTYITTDEQSTISK